MWSIASNEKMLARATAGFALVSCQTTKTQQSQRQRGKHLSRSQRFDVCENKDIHAVIKPAAHYSVHNRTSSCVYRNTGSQISKA